MSDDINVNMIADQLAKKVDLPDNRGQDGIDYVVEWKAPTESDPTWYRVYKSGWVEQGGVGYVSENHSSVDVIINLMKPMANSLYSYLTWATNRDGWFNDDWFNVGYPTTTSFKTSAAAGDFQWKVSGQGANQ